ncbi:arsenate reductase/protein-tyrosine-phosphatase family protein [Orenia marismortui]|uniref:arsenate reductase/protein-tyrosine-phosphatase family protein n=1 Tax=Orenia marismortui TaxID=46469 RepID=UPI00035D6788|nr:low molecular weight protein arginine phosphatase [Orenia marismortui]
MKKKFLLVCTGNTCRSSMAEALLKDLLVDAGKEGYEVKSAGISAFKGGSAASQAIEVMKDSDIDLTTHQTTPLTKNLVKEADIILTMTQRHKLYVLDQYPEFRAKVYTLKEYSSRAEDIQAETDQIEEIYKIIDRKRNNFISDHQEEIEELEKKRNKLLINLETIEKRIEELEIDLSQTLMPEKRKLASLKGDIDNVDISDPFGQPISVYRSCAKEIKSELKKIVENLD